MFTLRIAPKHKIPHPKPTVTSAEVMVFLMRMRALAAGDIQLAKLLEELEAYLPAPLTPYRCPDETFEGDA